MTTRFDEDADGPELSPDDPLAVILRPATDYLAPPQGSYESIRRRATRRRIVRVSIGAALTCAAAVLVALPLTSGTSDAPPSPAPPLAPPLAPPPATDRTTPPTPSPSPSPPRGISATPTVPPEATTSEPTPTPRATDLRTPNSSSRPTAAPSTPEGPGASVDPTTGGVTTDVTGTPRG